ncbi:MAG: hypothetical protein US60_C0031G0002 [Microgenomates group bacterium GW2011_GWC1_37_8]|uniref:Uncharacterized protein n=1 Tax=Candidatus Woesebacteria bacterium GW2011_GWB1_38_8 TaxID=1618570 RepID=A0A0G0NHN3_9BACT|nr:MAG: hypothetical protein US60_C0031G0002 [Microgenomates group bacterium GW2011_GWC1_37_8]KKQ85419.1 MAG: hypothetical protein UT08_C0006G0002 [Candidatus Woesebacteria bacterium GW2011_GWB1_38_8]
MTDKITFITGHQTSDLLEMSHSSFYKLQKEWKIKLDIVVGKIKLMLE